GGQDKPLVPTPVSFPVPLGAPVRLAFAFSSLLFNENSFAIQSPSISTHLTIFTHHSMARDHQRRRIRRACSRHRSTRRRPSEAFGDVGVRARLAVRNPLELLPHAPLKSRRADVERQGEVRLTAVQVA